MRTVESSKHVWLPGLETPLSEIEAISPIDGEGIEIWDCACKV